MTRTVYHAELLTVPPGFSEGMNCELNKEELKEKLSPSQAISISELISGSDLMHWASETGELEHQTSGEVRGMCMGCM